MPSTAAARAATAALIETLPDLPVAELLGLGEEVDALLSRRELTPADVLELVERHGKPA